MVNPLTTPLKQDTCRSSKSRQVHRIPGEGFAPGTDGFILTRFEDIEFVVKNPDRFPPTLSLGANALRQANIPIEDQKYVNAMMMSIVTLRPNIEALAQP